MYSTCLFCTGSLGRNEMIEHFPVGRRLAFDGAKGRLWVVCRKCERWNLTPLEARWEAIEECERAFRETKLRVSTEHIGLARLRDGTELIRVGEPQRPEMAAWRYGDQFERRTWRNVAYGTGAVALTVGALWGAPVILPFAGAGTVVSLLINGGLNWHQRRTPIAHISVTSEAGEVQRLPLARFHVSRAALARTTEGGWALDVAYLSSADRLEYTSEGLRHRTATARLTGDEAQRAAARILPHVNKIVAGSRTVQDAVGVIERAGSSEETFATAARALSPGRWNIGNGKVLAGSLAALPAPIRLALEMAAHEDAERRALEGELHVLEAAWRDAESIAGIADDLLLPESVTAGLDRLKARGEER